MTVLYGDTGKMSQGPLKTVTITSATPRTDNIDTTPANFRTSLPTTQTTGVGATFTVQASDFPIIEGAVSYKYTAFVLVSGKNNNGATQTVSVQPYLNGVAQGTVVTLSTPTANYWGHTVYRFYDVNIGDVLKVEAWATAANVSYDYCALMIFPTRLFLTKPNGILLDFLANMVAGNIVTLGNVPSTGGTISASINTQPFNAHLNPQAGYVTLSVGGTFSIPAIAQAHPTNGLLRANNGDTTLGTYSNAHSTNRNYARTAVPQTITFRELYL